MRVSKPTNRIMQIIKQKKKQKKKFNFKKN